MNKIISLFGLDFTTKSSTARLAAQVACTNTSPHSCLVAAQGALATEKIMICRKKDDFEEFKVTLLPKQSDNLVTSAMVKMLGKEGKIHLGDTSLSSHIIANGFALKTIGRVELLVCFHNERKCWTVTCVVVEELCVCTGIILGEEMCKKAKIVRGDELRPFTTSRKSAGKRLPFPAQPSSSSFTADMHRSIDERTKLEEENKKNKERSDAKKAAENRDRQAKVNAEAAEAGVAGAGEQSTNQQSGQT
jgi:hypothetical protein